MSWLSKQLEIKTMEDWYKVTPYVSKIQFNYINNIE